MSKYYSSVSISDIDDDILVDEAVALALATAAEIAARDDDDQAWAGTVRAEIQRRGLLWRLDDIIAAIREAERLDASRYTSHP